MSLAVDERTEQKEQRAALISDMLWLAQNIHFLLGHNATLHGHIDPARMTQTKRFEAHALSMGMHSAVELAQRLASLPSPNSGSR